MKKLLILLICTLLSIVASAQVSYTEVLNVKLSYQTLKPVEKILEKQTGTIKYSGDSLIVNNTLFRVIRLEALKSHNELTYEHLLLTAPSSALHRLYSCVLSYKKGKLYLVEIWRGDLTCKYYIVNQS